MPSVSTIRYLLLAVAGSLLTIGDASAKCRMKQPDVSISELRLMDSDSAIKLVGTGVNLVDSEDDLPHGRFVSTNGAQELVLFAPYGAVDDEYSEVEVREAGSEALALRDLPIESFKSGRGVELGMTVAQVQGLFGTCLKAREKTGPDLLLEYEIEGADADPELKAFGFPIYYAEYQFKRGKLVRYRFGFAYP